MLAVPKTVELPKMNRARQKRNFKALKFRFQLVGA